MGWPLLLRFALVCVAAAALGLLIATLMGTGQGGEPIAFQLPATATPGAASPEPAAGAATGTAPPTGTPAPTATARATSAPAATATRAATATAPTPRATAPAGATAAATATATGGPFTAYTVQPGDTLKAIAELYGVTVQELIAANELPNPDSLTVGTVVRVPREP